MVRASMFSAMAAMLVVALAVPEAFAAKPDPWFRC
jgi:hypothetical protein